MVRCSSISGSSTALHVQVFQCYMCRYSPPALVPGNLWVLLAVHVAEKKLLCHSDFALSHLRHQQLAGQCSLLALLANMMLPRALLERLACCSHAVSCSTYLLPCCPHAARLRSGLACWTSSLQFLAH